MQGCQYYNIDFLVLTTSDYIKSACAEITILNMGTSNFFINNSLLVKPGQSLSVNGNQGEEDQTIYKITFDDTAINNCTAIRKFYI